MESKIAYIRTPINNKLQLHQQTNDLLSQAECIPRQFSVLCREYVANIIKLSGDSVRFFVHLCGAVRVFHHLTSTISFSLQFRTFAFNIKASEAASDIVVSQGKPLSDNYLLLNEQRRNAR